MSALGDLGWEAYPAEGVSNRTNQNQDTNATNLPNVFTQFWLLQPAQIMVYFVCACFTQNDLNHTGTTFFLIKWIHAPGLRHTFEPL